MIIACHLDPQSLRQRGRRGLGGGPGRPLPLQATRRDAEGRRGDGPPPVRARPHPPRRAPPPRLLHIRILQLQGTVQIAKLSLLVTSNPDTYRVSHPVSDLGWVELDF